MRRILAVVAVAAMLSSAAACTSDDDKPGPKPSGTTINLGVIPIVDVAPVYLGRQKGFFSSRGIDLNLVPEQGGAPIVKGVLSGRYQFGFSNVTSLMAAQSSGAPLKAVANGVASTGRLGRDFSAVMVADGSPIRSPRDLVGKRVAVNTLKNIGDTTVRQSVRKDGGDAKNITFEAMPFSDMPGALRSGRVDAVWVVEPQLSETLTQGGQVIASNFVDTAPDLTVALYFTGTATIAKDPALVARFTAAVNESLRYASGHPDEVRAVLSTYTKISDIVKISLILPNWSGGINRSSLETLASLGRADGVFAKPPDLNQLLP
jgi:NitT/TauT family transport system substrate-binding protein